MKKICTLLIVLVLSGVMGSCTKVQTVYDCKKDCDDTFRELFLFSLPIMNLFEKEKCNNKCEGN